MKMDIIRLNGNKMTDKAETHAYLKRKLGFSGLLRQQLGRAMGLPFY